MFRHAVAALAAYTLALGVCAAASLRPAHDGSPRDPDILYIGRWDKSDPAVYHGYWSNVYLRARFTGTSVGIRLDGGTQLIASIDGEPVRTINAGSGVVALNAVPLKPGVHTLLVGSAGQNYEVSFQGLMLDPGAKTLPALPHPLIEFVGDSITVIDGPGNYSWLTGAALGCDHTQIAFSGVALTSGYGCSSKVGQDVQYFRLKNYNHMSDNPPVPWNFSYTPRMIVINLGQNDQCGGEPDATMRSSYVSFVHHLRAKFPKAQIVALRPFGGPYETPIRQAVEALNVAGDRRVSYIDTTGWLDKGDYVDGIHPNPAGQVKIVQRLAPLLTPLLTGR
ncbi:MAG: hypothetical protein JO250_08805 [Armatimonadetes bacterium]|nr:hypothetical protein [Armatimonadota bacterium]